MDYIMETVGLRKAYKDNIVVDDVNMHISKGAILVAIVTVIATLLIFKRKVPELY